MNTTTPTPTARPIQSPGAAAPRAARVVLLPTESCNLRCVYCFQPHTPVTMSRRTRDAVRRLLFRLVHEEQAPALHIEWYGGEPLAAWNVVDELSGYARNLALDHGIPFTMSMTTNGTLLSPTRFARLTELGCTDYQITLDGPPDAHDQRRRSAGGRGSFRRIWENLMAMRASDHSFRVVLRLGFDRRNMNELLAWIPELARVFGGDPRFELYARPIAYPGDSGPGFPAAQARESKAMIDRELAAAGISVVDMRRENRPGGIACHAGSTASIMVGADGTLHKCAVALESPSNRIGHLRADGTLALNLPLWQAWTTAASPCTVLNGITPAACPAQPEAACPALPCPAEPRSDACPASPAETSFACPATPQAACPALPCPASPDLACPAEPRSACPAEPWTACPAEPRSACPAEPRTCRADHPVTFDLAAHAGP